MTDRYSRQELFAPIGPAGQKKLREARAVIIGAGALEQPVQKCWSERESVL